MMDDGEHVPLEIIKEILGSALRRLRFQHNGGTYLLDGFPMTMDQLAMWKDLEGMPVR